MGAEKVDQLLVTGEVVHDYDRRLTNEEKFGALEAALPGARRTKHAGVNTVQWNDQVILFKQVTHLGHPWESFKKRIQIPKTWLKAYEEIASQGLQARFVGIYMYDGQSIFVDFDPTLYLQRKANNSAAHVATNDLYQALNHGTFERVDKNFNRLTSVRSNLFSEYISGDFAGATDARFSAFEDLNSTLFTDNFIYGLDAVKEMHAAAWPDRFQNEWAGFYLEFSLARQIATDPARYPVEFLKSKIKGSLDFDLRWRAPDSSISFLGDLKASDHKQREALGNDVLSLDEAIRLYGKFWYVIYEHETRHARDFADRATIEWNEWRKAMGHVQRKAYDQLSYHGKYKESVRFINMKVLEVNEANKHLVLGEFNQGVQPSGAARAPKVSIKKAHIENFLIYQARSPFES